MFCFIKDKGFCYIERNLYPELKVFKIVVNPKYFSNYHLIAARVNGTFNKQKHFIFFDWNRFHWKHHIYQVC